MLFICPFCRSHKVAAFYNGPTQEQAAYARSWGNDYDAEWWIQCKECGSTGPVGSSEGEAAFRWNAAKREVPA